MNFTLVLKCTNLVVIHIFNLVFQAEEAVDRPGGWRLNDHLQLLVDLLTLGDLGTIRLNCRGESNQFLDTCKFSCCRWLFFFHSEFPNVAKTQAKN